MSQKLSIQLFTGGPSICRAFLLFDMGCDTVDCPYSHDPKASGMPFRNGKLFIDVLDELRALDFSPMQSKYELYEMLGQDPEDVKDLEDEEIRRLLRRNQGRIMPVAPSVGKPLDEYGSFLTEILKNKIKNLLSSPTKKRTESTSFQPELKTEYPVKSKSAFNYKADSRDKTKSSIKPISEEQSKRRRGSVSCDVGSKLSEFLVVWWIPITRDVAGVRNGTEG